MPVQMATVLVPSSVFFLSEIARRRQMANSKKTRKSTSFTRWLYAGSLFRYGQTSRSRLYALPTKQMASVTEILMPRSTNQLTSEVRTDRRRLTQMAKLEKFSIPENFPSSRNSSVLRRPQSDSLVERACLCSEI